MKINIKNIRILGLTLLVVSAAVLAVVGIIIEESYEKLLRRLA